MQFLSPAQKVHAAKQAGQSKKMIAVQMRDQDVADGLKFGFVPPELHLCALAAIDQKIPFCDVEQLRAWVPVACRTG